MEGSLIVLNRKTSVANLRLLFDRHHDQFGLKRNQCSVSCMKRYVQVQMVDFIEKKKNRSKF